jgi:hypothetical protein
MFILLPFRSHVCSINRKSLDLSLSSKTCRYPTYDQSLQRILVSKCMLEEDVDHTTEEHDQHSLLHSRMYVRSQNLLRFRSHIVQTEILWTRVQAPRPPRIIRLVSPGHPRAPSPAGRARRVHRGPRERGKNVGTKFMRASIANSMT